MLYSMSDDAFDELFEQAAAWPEPVANVASLIEVAREEGETYRARMLCFELGMACVRYGVSVGLAQLASLGRERVSEELATLLRRAARLSDGHWCGLLRGVGAALGEDDALGLAALGKANALNQLVRVRNRFAHESYAAEEAPSLACSVAEAAAPLLDAPLCWREGERAWQERVGFPLRGGKWRRCKRPPPASPGDGAWLELSATSSWLRLTPYLPASEGQLLVLDGPSRSGKPWRSIDHESGEHQQQIETSDAIAMLVGADATAPRPLSAKPRFVGRQEATAVVLRALDEASEGSLRVVAFTGVFGIGRSRVLQEVAEGAAPALGFEVLQGAATPSRRGTLSLVRGALRKLPEADALVQQLQRLVGGSSLGDEGQFHARLEELEESLLRRAETQPLLLAFDDVQWADHASLLLLNMLAERAAVGGSGRVCLAFTAREEPRWPPALTQALGTIEGEVGPAATRLTLSALSSAEATKLLSGVGAVAADVTSELQHRAGGVPLYLVQPLLVWQETGSLAWRDGAWQAVEGNPAQQPLPALRDLLRARLATLFEPGSPAELVALQLLAALAEVEALPRGKIDELAQAMSWDERRVAHELHALSDAGLLQRGAKGHAFAQGLVRETLRADLEARPWYGEVLARLFSLLEDDLGEAEPALLASGFERAGDDVRAARWWHRAARYQARLGDLVEAHDQGLRWLANARGAARSEARVFVAELELKQGHVLDAQRRLEELDGTSLCGDMVHRFELARLQLQHAKGELDPVRVEELLSRVAGEQSRLALELQVAAAELLRGDRGLALAREAQGQMARVEADPGDLAYRAARLAFELLYQQRAPLSELLEAAAAAQREARRLGAAWAELDALNDAAVVELEAGHLEQAIERMSQVAARAEAEGLHALERGARMNLATFHTRAGNLEAAAAMADQAVRASELASAAHLASALSIQANVLRKSGRLEQALAAATRAATLKERLQDAGTSLALVMRGVLLRQLERFDEASEAGRQAATAAERWGNDEDLLRARLLQALLGASDDAQQLCAEAAALKRLRPLTRELLTEVEAKLAPPRPG